MKKGSKQTPEAIERMRLAKLGKKDSPETIERKRQAQLRPETLEANRNAHIGKKDSEATREKKRLSHLGELNVFFGQHHTQETLAKITGRPKTDEHCRHLSEAKKGIVPPNIEILKTSRVGATNSDEMILKQKATMALPEVKLKMSESHVGDKNSNWKGGVTPLNELIRESSKYYEWRNAVYKRDNYTDVITGEKGTGNLNAHHIVPYAEIMKRNHITTFEQAMACEELWDVSNGITMIEANHILYHARTGKPE
jgi:hypothetical protein